LFAGAQVAVHQTASLRPVHRTNKA
jgi:hypothetical protein